MNTFFFVSHLFVFFSLKLIHIRIIWEEETSSEKMPQPGWLVSKCAIFLIND